MLRDLAQHDAPTDEPDVLIVGAGIAGLLLAVRLREHGLRVVVLESGEREQTDAVHPLNRVVLTGDRYAGATEGRFRCLGGTSTRWGGALIPFLAHDLAPRPYLDVPLWPVGMDALLPYLPAVERIFGVEAKTYDEELVRELGAAKDIPSGDPDFVARFAKWPVFRQRNLATLFKKEIERDPGLEVWLNATVTGVTLDPASGRIRAVTAACRNGKSRSFAAPAVVLCPGAIEATRLLLLFDRAHDGRLFDGCEALGGYFHDHVSRPMATIAATRPDALNRMAGFRFIGSTMRSLRYELSARAQEADGVAGAFGHISFQTERPSGVDALRELLRSLQKRGRIDPGLLAPLLKDLPYLAKAIYWRFMRHQLAWPADARHELHVVAEQTPRRANRIALADERDAFGQPLAAIDWHVGDAERATLNAYQRRFDGFWSRHGLDSIGRLDWLHSPERGVSAVPESKTGDVYHPGGSTRMGRDRRTAVVDGDLRTFAVPNLWVLATSTFPTGGSANPTLTLMLFALRLADHLKAIAARRAQ